ncbi:fimbrial protein [Atlantibacter sp.]|uniref:fimbrial protein n=1 Tax=Atlantibacter sp. TaxID=1903473 RepID=UPI00289D8F49|nr:fimbrial protein [Atlantibacter sp.]
MKRNVFTAVITAAALLSSTAYAADGAVKFTGEVIDEQCTVDIGGASPMEVPLGRVSKAVFKATAGTDASTTKFTIILKDCPATLTNAKVKFEGAPDPTDTALLAIDAVTGAATGVAIKLMTADKAQLGLHQTNSYSYALESGKDNKLDFYAAYRSTSATVGVGPANAVANFTINYD